jgi:hypothetical protein
MSRVYEDAFSPGSKGNGRELSGAVEKLESQTFMNIFILLTENLDKEP